MHPAPGWRVAVAALCLLMAAASAPAVAAATAQDAFRAGVTAYRAGRYEAALKHFETAERRGMRHPNLELNLGLTHYRLGRYDEAQTRLERLRRDLRYTAIADYHLGLIAAQTGRREDAAEYFEAAQFETANPRVRNMVLIALLRMDNLGLDQDPFATSAAHPRPRFYARASAGLDSNPELGSGADALDRPVTDVVGEGAGFADLRADLELPFLVSPVGETALRGEVQARPYLGDSGYDELGGSAALRQSWRTLNWRMGLIGEGGASWLDGEAYASTGSASIDARREFETSTVTLIAETMQVRGEGHYAYLDGWRHRAGAEMGQAYGLWRGRTNYEYEVNDRADLTQDDEFSSYSPRRQVVGLAAAAPSWRNVLFEGRLRYRDSRYPEDNRFAVAGGIAVQRRDDRLLTAGLRGRLRGGETWNWLGDLQYNRNTSTIGEYNHTRHLLLIGIEWLR